MNDLSRFNPIDLILEVMISKIYGKVKESITDSNVDDNKQKSSESK